MPFVVLFLQAVVMLHFPPLKDRVIRTRDTHALAPPVIPSSRPFACKCYSEHGVPLDPAPSKLIIKKGTAAHAVGSGDKS